MAWNNATETWAQCERSTMVKIEYLKILLPKSSDAIYIAGQTIFGTVRLKVAERLKASSIELKFVGTSRVYWWVKHDFFWRLPTYFRIYKCFLRKETKGSGQRRSTNHYRSIVTHINYKHTFSLPSYNYNTNELHIEVGELALPFQIQIPHTMPTSFEHEYGRIRYTIHVIVHMPWSFDRYTSKLISVINQLDLNANPCLKHPQGIVETKHVCCSCCHSRPIEVDFSMLKGGYVPGEILFFRVDFDNQSSKQILETYVNLVQTLKLSGQNETKLVKRVVCTARFLDRIKSRSSETWESSCLVIPPLCPTLNGLSSIIQVNYSLVLFLHLSGLSCAKSLTLPIVIGTVPIKNHHAMHDKHLRRDTLDNISFEPDRSSYVCKVSKSESSRNRSFSAFFDPEFDMIHGEFMDSEDDEFKPSYPYYKS